MRMHVFVIKCKYKRRYHFKHTTSNKCIHIIHVLCDITKTNRNSNSKTIADNLKSVFLKTSWSIVAIHEWRHVSPEQFPKKKFNSATIPFLFLSSLPLIDVVSLHNLKEYIFLCKTIAQLISNNVALNNK